MLPFSQKPSNLVDRFIINWFVPLYIAQTSNKPNKKISMIEDIIKKAFYTGVGFLANPKGFKEKIDDLVNKGDMTAEEGKKAFTEFEKDFKAKTDDLEENIQGMIRTALDKMDIPSAEKVTAMEKRIKSLEVKVGKLSKELKEIKATETPTVKKTTTRKKPAARKKTTAKKATTTKTKKAE